tara:strand:+ start:1127 stop:1741 length:615 start_codon:yes stop_codon:yes gene_type:complete
MSQKRNIQWLNEHKVIYRQMPINDVATIETEKYMFFENGTYEHYCLFNTKAKITTYKSLKWHFLVLYYLNQDNGLLPSYVYEFIADKENGFVTFFISDKKLNAMIDDVFATGGDPPKNKLRKVIFKDFCMLDVSEKLKIVGKLIGRKNTVDAEAIYQCMLDINELGNKITWNKVANILGCSTRTVHRNLNNSLKNEKILLNEEI